MAASRTTQDKLLKTVYQPRLRLQFNMKNILLEMIARKTKVVKEGEKLHVKLHYGRTGGLGYTATNNLAVAHHQLVDAADFNYCKMNGRIEVDGHHMASAAADYAAIVEPLDLETKGMIKEQRNAIGFDLFGDGTGALTTFPAQTAEFGTGVAKVWVDSIKGLYLGQAVDLLAHADGADTNGWRQGIITNIDRTVGSEYFEADVTAWTGLATFNTTPTDYKLYRSLTAAESSYGNAFTGLTGIIATTGTYGGINRETAGNEWWRGQTWDTGTTESPTHQLIQQGLDTVETNSDGQTNIIVTTYEIWSWMAATLVAQKQYAGNLMKLNGWCQAIDFAGIPIIRDKYCPKGSMFFLDTDTLTFMENDGGHWIDEDGAILHRILNKYAFEAAWVRQFELVCDKPNANLHATGLKETYYTPS